MRRRTTTFRKACRVLGVDPTAPFEEIAQRYHALANELRAAATGDDPAAAAQLIEASTAWSRMKYEVKKRRTQLSHVLQPQHERFLTSCDWPHPATTRSAAFGDCDLRPTDLGRCYRVFRAGAQVLTLYRHPEDAHLLFARNEQGRVVQVNGVRWWTDADGKVQPIR